MQNTEYSAIKVQAAGREWTLLRPADLETLWNAITDEEFTEDERLPYWVELWPASIALANWLALRKDDINGNFCLDLGCGLGLTAMAASMCGAKVVAVDYEKAALDFACLNVHENAVPAPLWTVADWRQPAFAAHKFPFIWGGDIMYERRFVTPVLDCIEYALAPGGKVWLAEPNRNVYDDFRAALIKRGWSSVKVNTSMVDPLHVQKSKVTVNLWELTHE
ncbi:methyltransferase domain-containing protein [Desulfovibrio sp. OttesenSCG-928-F07]|nr:methyltransferase domain-containing protein [Desulfovibrio sp. OttesenSCG-928-F07]